MVTKTKITNFLPGKGLKLPRFALPDFRSGDMFTVFGIVILTLLLYIVIMSIITSVTGSIWLTKVATRPLKDTYDVVLFNDGGNALGIKNLALESEIGTLNPEELDEALANLPAVIFPDLKPSEAQMMVDKIGDMGGMAGVN